MVRPVELAADQAVVNLCTLADARPGEVGRSKDLFLVAPPLRVVDCEKVRAHEIRCIAAPHVRD